MHNRRPFLHKIYNFLCRKAAKSAYQLKIFMQIQAILRKIATIESMKVNHDKFGTIEEPRESRTLPAEAAADFHDGAIV